MKVSEGENCWVHLSAEEVRRRKLSKFSVIRVQMVELVVSVVDLGAFHE